MNDGRKAFPYSIIMYSIYAIYTSILSVTKHLHTQLSLKKRVHKIPLEDFVCKNHKV